jgi:hypothetical protein
VIITFSKDGAQELVAINGGRPMVQDNKGCHSMHQNCETFGGWMSVSDEPVPGWTPCHFDYDHIYYSIDGYGDVGSGQIRMETCKALGFNYDSNTLYWSAANNFHKMDEKQVREFWRVWSTQKARPACIAKANEYLAGLFPVEVVPPPEPKKKGKARKGEAVISLSL